MKIISWNVNGFRSNIISKGKYTGKFESDSNLAEIIDKCDPDIICFQETKCDNFPFNKKEQSFQWFEYWNASKEDGARSGSRYSGTSIWTKIKPLSVTYDLPTLSLQESEGRIIIMKFQDFTLINTYVPNSGTNFDFRTKIWDEAIAEYLSILREDKVNIIWAGDMNVARTEKDVFFKPTKISQQYAGFTPEERSGMEKILDIGYSDVFREKNPDSNTMFTWWNPRVPSCRLLNKGWRIDYFIVSNWMLEKVISTDVLTFSKGSDHAAIFIQIDLINLKSS